MRILILFISLALTTSSWGARINDGSDVLACKGVTDVCMSADVTGTDSKTGKTVHGYQPGEHKKDGKGLWADCVTNLAQGKTVAGVTGVSSTSAQACLDGEKAAHKQK